MGRRTVVFRKGGVIRLKAGIRILPGHGDLTIAGQTAPGGGIGLARLDDDPVSNVSLNLLRIEANNVIVRYVRLRPGLLRRSSRPVHQLRAQGHGARHPQRRAARDRRSRLSELGQRRLRGARRGDRQRPSRRGARVGEERDDPVVHRLGGDHPRPRVRPDPGPRLLPSRRPREPPPQPVRPQPDPEPRDHVGRPRGRSSTTSSTTPRSPRASSTTRPRAGRRGRLHRQLRRAAGELVRSDRSSSGCSSGSTRGLRSGFSLFLDGNIGPSRTSDGSLGREDPAMPGPAVRRLRAVALRSALSGALAATGRSRAEPAEPEAGDGGLQPRLPRPVDLRAAGPRRRDAPGPRPRRRLRRRPRRHVERERDPGPLRGLRRGGLDARERASPWPTATRTGCRMPTRRSTPRSSTRRSRPTVPWTPTATATRTWRST